MYQPFLSENATATYASNASVIYSPNAQTVTLSATVISADGPVTGGTETFTILNGSNVVGTPVTSNVVSGAASGAYTIPAGTLGGVYTIQAVFSGTSTLSGSSDSSHTLTISDAATTTAANSATTTFSASNQTISLSATVTSSAGIVNEGTETFTILSGTTTVGTPATANVSERGRHCQLYAARWYDSRHLHDRGRLQWDRRLRHFHRHEPVVDDQRAPPRSCGTPQQPPPAAIGTHPVTGWVAWSQPRPTM